MNDRILEHFEDEFSSGHDVVGAEAETLLDALIESENESLIAGVLSAWNNKGTTEDELFEFATLMRARMKRIASRHERFVDTVGTGGSLEKTFNVSTAAAFVIAGAGLAVAKHGNRAATSRSGSSDVLATLGVEIDIDQAQTERHLNDNGLCFMFAPRFHSLSPTLAAARRLVGRPTIFNNLGPLCNPASAPHHVIGVWTSDWLERTANVLLRLGAQRSWVVNGENGLDEISLVGKTHIVEVADGKTERFEISAADFEVYTLGKDIPPRCSAEVSAGVIRNILNNELKGRDAERLVLINAAAAIFVAGHALELSEAFLQAQESIRSGAALAKLQTMTNGVNQ